MDFINRILESSKSHFRDIYLYSLRKKIKLCYPNSKIEKGKVSLNYYDRIEPNLGDALSPIIVEYILQQKGFSLNQPTRKTKNLYAVGSILFTGYQDATVWGSGLLTKPAAPPRGFLQTNFFRKLDIRCVRGPLTQAALKQRGFNCPSVYGDPGCLMPLIYFPKTEKQLDFLVIPHYAKEKEIRNLVPEQNLASMLTTDYKHVIDKICSAKRVISSSLHGIILAEAYGVPAIFYNDRNAIYDFKYEDWYKSTGRTKWPIATKLEEAITMDIDNSPPDLSEMQKRLINSFPYDLWED